MKKYFVNVHYDVCRPVVVLAESEEEAIRLAENNGSDVVADPYDENWDITESCVTGAEEIPSEPQPDEPCNNCIFWKKGFGCLQNCYNSSSMVMFGHCGHKQEKK